MAMSQKSQESESDMFERDSNTISFKDTTKDEKYLETVKEETETQKQMYESSEKTEEMTKTEEAPKKYSKPLMFVKKKK